MPGPGILGRMMPIRSMCRDLARLITAAWGRGAVVEQPVPTGPHEARYLKLDSSKAAAELGWRPAAFRCRAGRMDGGMVSGLATGRPDGLGSDSRANRPLSGEDRTMAAARGALVCGVTGFIGATLAGRLIAEGLGVCVPRASWQGYHGLREDERQHSNDRGPTLRVGLRPQPTQRVGLRLRALRISPCWISPPFK